MKSTAIKNKRAMQEAAVYVQPISINCKGITTLCFSLLKEHKIYIIFVKHHVLSEAVGIKVVHIYLI